MLPEGWLAEYDNGMEGSLFDAEEFARPTPKWEVAERTDFSLAQIVFNRPIEEPYDYVIPEAFQGTLQPGMRVKVPLGRGDKLTPGYCVGVRVAGEDDASRLHKFKQVEEVLDVEPLIDAKMLGLTQWIAWRYLASWGQVLEAVVPAGVKNKAGTRETTYYRLTSVSMRMNDEQLSKLPGKQAEVIRVARTKPDGITGSQLAELAHCGPGPIKTLVKKGWLESFRERALKEREAGAASAKQENLKLNVEQAVSLKAIVDASHEGRHETFLLHGVTGSGKTEVYIQAIQDAVARGKQAIVLVPEISLTPQTIRRFRSRFDEVAVLHSHLSDADRHYEWQRIASGEVKVVVGARSAIFAPLARLGLIIIDEEHETTFKQDTTPRYHAREVAQERARREGIPLVLGSATPTLESCYRVKQGEYKLLRMTKRIDGLTVPRVDLIDTLHDPLIKQRHSIGRAMQVGVDQALKDGGQVILFFNLRGFSPVLWCPSCSEKLKCPDCDLSLTWHKDKGKVICHTCEFSAVPPQRCPKCNEGTLKYLGAGTQKLEEEVRTKFANYKTIRMDSDSMRKPGSHDEALERFRHGEVQILLGTQMISKGLDFPNVTFVGVIDTDSMLFQPDFRASERTFQLISQVSGRTGRGSKGGRVFVQTSSRDEPAIALAAQHDFNAFVRLELGHRQEQGMPPFKTLTRIICRGPDEGETLEYATLLSEVLREAARKVAAGTGEGPLPIRILGPCPPHVARIKQMFRFHLQITAESFEQIRALWDEVKGKLPKGFARVEQQVDVDAMNLR